MPRILDQFGRPIIRDRPRPHWRRLLAKYDAAQMTDDNLHYVPIRDDFSGLADKIEWCDQNPEECRWIGHRAKAFFETHSTPRVIWQHVVRRLEGRRTKADD